MGIGIKQRQEKENGGWREGELAMTET